MLSNKVQASERDTPRLVLCFVLLAQFSVTIIANDYSPLLLDYGKTNEGCDFINLFLAYFHVKVRFSVLVFIDNPTLHVLLFLINGLQNTIIVSLR